MALKKLMVVRAAQLKKERTGGHLTGGDGLKQVPPRGVERERIWKVLVRAPEEGVCINPCDKI
jgi:hypothetical protein